MKRGYLTIGIGEYYRFLSKNLIRSYRLNTYSDIPFCMVTDKKDDITDHLADIVIVEPEKLKDGFLYKLRIFDYTPFEETIFIDADCLIISDINFLWNFFQNTAVGVIGHNSSNPENLKAFFNYDIVNKETGIKGFPVFNGGIYYFKKNEKAKKVFSDANYFSDFYDKYGMVKVRNMKNEEPVMSLALAYNNISAKSDDKLNTMYCVPGITDLRIDILRKKCSFRKYGTIVNPAIMHFLTSGTRLFHYRREIKRMNLRLWGLHVFIIDLLMLPMTFYYALKVLIYRVYKKRKLALANLLPFTINGY